MRLLFFFLLVCLCSMLASVRAEDKGLAELMGTSSSESGSASVGATTPPLTPCEIMNKIKLGASLDQFKEAIGKDNAAKVKNAGSNYQWSSHFGILDITLGFLSDGKYFDGSYPSDNLNQNEMFLVDLIKRKTITLSQAEELMGKPGLAAGSIYQMKLSDTETISITTDVNGKVNGVVSSLNCEATPEN
jgi:hypothetical protein